MYNQSAGKLNLIKSNLSGGNDEMDTPVPIPNTAVKHLSADNTWLDTARESKSLPDLYQAFCVNSTKACFIFI